MMVTIALVVVEQWVSILGASLGLGVLEGLLSREGDFTSSEIRAPQSCLEVTGQTPALIVIC